MLRQRREHAADRSTAPLDLLLNNADVLGLIASCSCCTAPALVPGLVIDHVRGAASWVARKGVRPSHHRRARAAARAGAAERVIAAIDPEPVPREAYDAVRRGCLHATTPDDASSP